MLLIFSVIKLGKIQNNIAALLRIEALIQDLCVEAILNKSKDYLAYLKIYYNLKITLFQT